MPVSYAMELAQDLALDNEERTWQVRDKLRALLSEKEYREFFEREHGTLQRIVGDDSGEYMTQFVSWARFVYHRVQSNTTYIVTENTEDEALRKLDAAIEHDLPALIRELERESAVVPSHAPKKTVKVLRPQPKAKEVSEETPQEAEKPAKRAPASKTVPPPASTPAPPAPKPTQAPKASPKPPAEPVTQAPPPPPKKEAPPEESNSDRPSGRVSGAAASPTEYLERIESLFDFGGETSTQQQCKWRRSCYETGELPEIEGFGLPDLTQLWQHPGEAFGAFKFGGVREKTLEERCKWRTSCYETGELPEDWREATGASSLFDWSSFFGVPSAEHHSVEHWTEFIERHVAMALPEKTQEQLCRWRKSCSDANNAKTVLARYSLDRLFVKVDRGAF